MDNIYTMRKRVLVHRNGLDWSAVLEIRDRTARLNVRFPQVLDFNCRKVLVRDDEGRKTSRQLSTRLCVVHHLHV